MAKQTELEIKVGLFITLGLGLILMAILVLGSTENMLSKKNHYFTHFPNVDGLVPGAKVVVGGVPVGVVTTIDFDSQTRSVRVDYSMTQESSKWIHKDSTAEIVTQGMLGDKYITVRTGSPELPQVVSGSEIPELPSKDLAQFLSKGDQLMVSLNGIATSVDRLLKSFESENRSEIFFRSMTSTARNLSSMTERLNEQLDNIKVKSTVAHLNGILEKIDHGEGTLGALVNDPGVYDSLKSFLGEANRNRVVRNLVRQTIKGHEEADDAAALKAKTDAAKAPASQK